MKYTYAAFLLIPASTVAMELPKDTFVSLYGGVATRNEIEEVLTAEADFEDTYLVGVGVGKRLASLNRHLDVETEAVLVQYMGGQTNPEINGGASLRWKTFPWNETVRTSVAVGTGLSYALGAPRFEQRLNGSSPRLLAYLPVEATFARPDSAWEGVVHLHHRSTAFGLFGDEGGANHVTLGIRKRF